MKSKNSIVLTAVIASALAISSFAAGTLVSIDVDPSIKILVNGEEFHPKDANGNDVMTFTYNGTTYAPLRALAEAYGLEVGYDSSLKMATVSEKSDTYMSNPSDTAENKIGNFKTVAYSGTGDSVIDIETPENEAWVLYVEGNAENRYFSVKGYDNNGDYSNSFVSTGNYYSGVTLDNYQDTTTLEINASGDWYIEVRSIYTCDAVNDYGNYNGTGDSVILINTNIISPRTAYITGNSNRNYFSVKAYDGYLDYVSSLVSTGDNYSGTVLIKDNPCVIAITSTGDWSIDFKK